MPENSNQTATPLSFEAVIPNTGTPIGFAGGEGESDFIRLQHYMTAAQIQQLLNLRGCILTVTICESAVS